MMTFLFPGFLWFAGLMALPVIIHFFNFQRARKVYFTNVALLRTVKQTTNARNRWKDLVVMLLRMMFILALVAAFAQPIIPQGGQEQPTEFVQVFVDNSYSLQNEQANRPIFNIAQNYASRVAGLFPKSTRYQLLDNGFDQGSLYYISADKLSDQVFELDYSNTGRPLAQILARQQQALDAQAGGAPSDFFVISDFQRSSMGSLANVSLSPDHQYHLVQVMPTAQTNAAIDTVVLTNPIVRVKESNSLRVKIRNYSDERLEALNVKLFIGGRQASANVVSIAPLSYEVLELNFLLSSAEPQSCRISAEDYPVTFDNDYHFVLKAAPNVSIVTISASPNRFLETVFETESIFETQHFSVGSVDYSVLKQADLIVLHGLRTLSASLRDALLDAAAQQAQLVVFPAANFDQQAYEGLLQMPLYPKTPEPQAAMSALAPPDEQNPFYEGVFEKVDARMEMPKAISLMGWNGGSHILQYKGGMPFLSQIRWAGSQAYLFTSPLDTDLTNLPKHALFVPIMYRIALSGQQKAERLAWSFDEDVATIKLDSISKGDIFQLGETGFIPHQRVVNGQLMMDIPKKGVAAGVYDLVELTEKVKKGQIAFNLSRTESQLTVWDNDELANFFEATDNVHIYRATNEEIFEKDFMMENKAIPLWRYFLIASLIILLLEQLLIRIGRK